LGCGRAGFAGELAFGVRGGTAVFAVHLDDDPFSLSINGRAWWAGETVAGRAFTGFKIAGGGTGAVSGERFLGWEKVGKCLGWLELKYFEVWGKSCDPKIGTTNCARAGRTEGALAVFY
jgi:hypothetical protein